MTEIKLRSPTDAELSMVFRPHANHVVGTVDGEPVVYIRFQTIDGRRWGMMHILGAVAPAVFPKLFYAVRRRLTQEREPVYALAQNAQSPRLLRLIGLEPTGEVSVGKEVWRWTPGP